MSDFIEEQRQLFERFKQINLDRDLARLEQMNLDRELARLDQISLDRDLAQQLDGELNKNPEDNEHNRTRYILKANQSNWHRHGFSNCFPPTFEF